MTQRLSEVPIQDRSACRGEGLRAAGAILSAFATMMLVLDVCHAQVRKNGPEFQVNTYTQFFQIQPRVEALDSGRFIVIWQGSSPDPNSNYGVRAQIFDPGAQHLGDEFLITTYALYDHRIEEDPAISSNEDGELVVAWESYASLDDSHIGIQRYSRDLSQQGREIVIDNSAPRQVYPKIAIGAGGSFVVTWLDIESRSNYARNVRAMKFNPDASAASEELVLTFQNGLAWAPNVAMQPDGGFIVVWQEDGAGIVAQRFDTSAQQLGAPIRVDAESGDAPEIATTGDGNFIVVWQRNGEKDDPADVFGQRYTADGATIGARFRANTNTANIQEFPSIDIDTLGNFVVVWESYSDAAETRGQDGSGRGVFAQYFNEDGERLGHEFQVNDFTTGDQSTGLGRESDVAMLSDGAFVATWTSMGQDGDRGGVFAQVFDVDRALAALCGDTNSDLRVTSRDALILLRSTIGLVQCDRCVCDTDSSGTISASDALATLQVAVGLERNMFCPFC